MPEMKEEKSCAARRYRRHVSSGLEQQKEFLKRECIASVDQVFTTGLTDNFFLCAQPLSTFNYLSPAIMSH